MTKTEENLKWVRGKIADLEDDYTHYTMVEKDKCRQYFIECDLKAFKDIEADLVRLVEYDKERR